MNLGAFSISLSVADIERSKSFYAKLGFVEMGDSGSDKWAILKNGDHTIGLFEGMFEGNILTFNPGWDQNASPLDSFTDIREIQASLKSQGVELAQETDAEGEGPASIALVDPDGNQILIDQHR